MKNEPPGPELASEETVDNPTEPALGPAPADLERIADGSRYRLGPLLGEGGRGQVYRAYDLRLKRDVALKFLTSQDREQVGLLLREAQAQARVDHPHVCKVYEVDDLGERPFICMQLVTGRTLRDAAPGLDLRVKVGALVEIAEAIEAAHRLGIIHRDLKPANILVEETASGGLHPYVMDFGLAREVGATLTHSIVGTPAYMAPEQAHGDTARIGPRTDVYGLGATLYEVLGGRPPIPGDSVLEVLANVAALDPVPLRRLDPRLPRDLEVIALACLEKDPARRYPTARALADDLRRFLAHEPIRARPASLRYRVGKRLRRHAGVGLLVLASLVAVAVALGVAWRPRWKPRVVPLGLGYEEWSGAVSLAPDGRELVYASKRDGHWRIYAESLSGTSTGPSRALTPPEMLAYAPHYSRDGAWVFFTRQLEPERLEVDRVPRAGGVVTPLAPEASEADDCGGGRLLIRYSHSDDCYDCERLVLRTADGVERLLLEGDSDDWLQTPSCDQAGRRAVYMVKTAAQELQHFEVIDLESGRVSPLGPPLADLAGPIFHPDGKSVLFARAGRIWEVSPGRDPTPVTDGIDDAWPALSEDGRLLVYNEVRRDAPVFVQPLDGRPVRRLSPIMAIFDRLRLSSDGEELVLVSTRDGKGHIIAMSTRDGSERLLAEGTNLALSADGQDVYFVRPVGKDCDLWTVPRQSGEVHYLARLPGRVTAMAYAADGLHLSLLTASDMEAWRAPVDGSGPPAREAPAPIIQIVPSPDGKWTLVRRNPDTDLVVPAGADLADPRAISMTWSQARWQLDGSLLGGDEGSIKRLEPDSRAISLVARVAEAVDDPHSWVLSPDGKTLYLAATQDHVRRVLVENFAERPRP